MSPSGLAGRIGGSRVDNHNHTTAAPDSCFPAKLSPNCRLVDLR